MWLTNQVKAFGNILPLDRSQGANSSYQISFQGPSVRCENTVTNLTVPGGENFTLVHSIGSDSTYNIFFNRPLGFYNNSEGKSVVVMECTSRLCKMHTSTYTANISYISGTQSIAYDATETTPLKFWPTLTPLEVEFSTWKGSVAEWFRAANSVAIWDSMVTSLFVLYNETIRSWNETTGRYENDGNYGFDIGEQIGWYKLPDGKEIELNRILTFGVPKSYPEGVRGDPSPRSEHAQRQGKDSVRRVVC